MVDADANERAQTEAYMREVYPTEHDKRRQADWDNAVRKSKEKARVEEDRKTDS